MKCLPFIGARVLVALSVPACLSCGSADPTTGDDLVVVDKTPVDRVGRDAGRDAGAARDAKVPVAVDDPDVSRPPVKPDDGIEKCAGIRKDAPAGMGAVDVIFVIDTSGSMAPIIAQVQANIEGFIKDFEGSSADTRVTLITLENLAAGTSVENDANRYRFVPAMVDSKVLFQVSLDTFPQYQDFMRPNAATQFVMITDDQDLISADAFNQQMSMLLGHPFTQHAIASENNAGAPCLLPIASGNPLCEIPIPVVCTATSVGAAYYTLADTTMGEKISICSSDFTVVFDRLRSAVIAGVPLPCEYALAEASNPDFDSTTVQIVYTPQAGDDREIPKAASASQCGDNAAWYFDDEDQPSSISLCPTACTQVASGGSLDIAFGCTPQVVL